MADRLTQLQDSVNLQAENFCNSIGILQQLAQPSTFPEFEKTGKPSSQPQEDYAQLFATMIARTAKDMDVLIESLPGEEAAPELQANNLQKLEIENNEAANRLQEVVMRGECLLAQVQKALAEIASQQLSSKQQVSDESSRRNTAPPNPDNY
ncbi:mediator of RNA polymerase II transcription subunit 21 [Galendromus occidentalis]|uniref:Mediator of RNA polymerase II transcription subunit 21 n=1 Tax=Galendromus occidentalis TaxID=34638 RepID=A0AAJ6QY55_9ACAR|nr:mediator of RNA polymerase II transcription subunit 21 [Galendromus occidentalis]